LAQPAEIANDVKLFARAVYERCVEADRIVVKVEVSNRGRARQKIFHGPTYYYDFLNTLEESHSRFDAIFHAYCLMNNHYHLLITRLISVKFTR